MALLSIPPLDRDHNAEQRDQMRALAQYISDGPLGCRINGALGSPPESPQVSQPSRLGGIIEILKTAILLDRRGMGERPALARLHEAIDEPVPIRGGFAHPALDVSALRGAWFQDRGEIVRQPFVVHPLILLMA